MTNTELLKQKMRETNSPEGWLADKLKIAQSSLNLKINNQRSFSIKEMFIISDILNLDVEEMKSIFFDESVA